MSLPAKTLTCHCCEFSTGVPYRHCPSCHSVAIHGVSDFSYRAIVLDVCVYEGTSQADAVASAQAGGGYVTISPILVDFRDLNENAAFRPEMRTRYGTAVVPLDAVRRGRQLDGAEYDPGRPPTPDYEQRVTAGATLGSCSCVTTEGRVPCGVDHAQAIRERADAAGTAALVGQLVRAVGNAPVNENARAAALRATQTARHADGHPMSGFRAYGP